MQGLHVANIYVFCISGRIHHAQGHYEQAVQYLQQGLHVADEIQRPEDEAKIRHRLGLALWGQGDLQAAQTQLYGAIDLFENMRRESHFNSEYKLSLFDLQTASYQALQVSQMKLLDSFTEMAKSLEIFLFQKWPAKSYNFPAFMSYAEYIL